MRCVHQSLTVWSALLARLDARRNREPTVKPLHEKATKDWFHIELWLDDDAKDCPQAATIEISPGALASGPSVLCTVWCAAGWCYVTVPPKQASLPSLRSNHKRRREKKRKRRPCARWRPGPYCSPVSGDWAWWKESHRKSTNGKNLDVRHFMCVYDVCIYIYIYLISFSSHFEVSWSRYKNAISRILIHSHIYLSIYIYIYACTHTLSHTHTHTLLRYTERFSVTDSDSRVHLSVAPQNLRRWLLQIRAGDPLLNKSCILLNVASTFWRSLSTYHRIWIELLMTFAVKSGHRCIDLSLYKAIIQ